MRIGIFVLSFTSGLAIILLALISRATKMSFWPPPRPDSWQRRTLWTLFRALVAGVVILAVLDFRRPNGTNPAWRFYVGLPLALIGFAGAFDDTLFLGWQNAHGERQGLITRGPYKWSRNPIYVASLVGVAGLGLLIHSTLVHVLLGTWAVLYFVAPFLEEPWLEKEYGAAFMSYRARVPRFVGFVR